MLSIQIACSRSACGFLREVFQQLLEALEQAAVKMRMIRDMLMMLDSFATRLPAD